MMVVANERFNVRKRQDVVMFAKKDCLNIYKRLGHENSGKEILTYMMKMTN